MATGAPGTNGVWLYGEDDSEATFSALLNKAGTTVNTQLGLDRARLTALEARGKVVKMVTAEYSTVTTTTSTSFVTTNLTASITPSSSTSKILALITINGRSPLSDRATYVTLYRGTVAGTNLGGTTTGFGNIYTVSGGVVSSQLNFSYVDSPATTSATTYTVAFRVDTGTGGVNYGKSTLTLIEVLP